MQLLQLLLEMAYLRCCVWIQAPLTAGCCLLAFAGAAFPHRHERHGLRLLRQAKHRRGDAAIQALGLAFLTKRAAGAAALSPGAATFSPGGQKMQQRCRRRGMFAVYYLRLHFLGRPAPPAPSEGQQGRERRCDPPLSPQGVGRANSWGQLPSSTAEMRSRTPSHCTR